MRARATARQDPTAAPSDADSHERGRDPDGSAAEPGERRDLRSIGEPPGSSPLLVVSLAIVAWGTFELLEPSAAARSLHPAARGSIVLGIIAFGGASLALLGVAPTRPPSGAGTLAQRCRRMFFRHTRERGSAGDADGTRRSRGGPGTRGAGIRLGWARMATCLGVLLLLLAGLLSLTPYSAAVLMILAGSACVLALRSA